MTDARIPRYTSGAQTQTDPFAKIETTARNAKIPVNYLFALAEAAGAKSPEDQAVAADRIAAAVGPMLAQGGDFKALLRQQLGPDADRVRARAIQIAQERYPEQFAAKQAERQQAGGQGGIGAGLATGVNMIQQAYGSAVEGAGRSLGLEGVQEAGRASAEANAAEGEASGRGLKTVDDIKGLGSAAQFAGEQLAVNAPQMGVSMAGAAAGAAVGSVVPIIGTGIGALIGGVAVNLPFFYGMNRERQKEQVAKGELTQVSEGAAALTAIPQAALDTIVDKLFLGMGPTPAFISSGGLLTRGAKGVVAGAVVEVPTEIGQTVLERMQAGLPLADEEAIKEYRDVGIAAGLLGGTVGGVSNAIQKPKGPMGAALQQGTAPPQLPAPGNGGTVIPPAPPGGGTPTGMQPYDGGPIRPQGGPTPPAPQGPLGGAATAAPPPLFPDAAPGQPVTITAPDMPPIEGTFDAENPVSITITTLDGEVLEIPRTEIEAGTVQIAPTQPVAPGEGPTVKDGPAPIITEGQPEGLAATAAAAIKPKAPAPRVPQTDIESLGEEQARARLAFIEDQGKTNGWKPDLVAERDALRRVVDQFDGLVAKKDGTPFKTEAQTKAALKNRGLDPEGYDIEARNGGFVARPKAAGPLGQTPENVPTDVQAGGVDDAGQEQSPLAPAVESPEVPGGPVLGQPDPVQPAVPSQMPPVGEVPPVEPTPPVEPGSTPPARDPQITATPMAPAAVRSQPDMLGGEATSEEAMAAKERRKREWGQFLGIAEHGKSDWDGELEGRPVRIRRNRVRLMAGDKASDADMILDTEGMSKEDIAAWTRDTLRRMPPMAGQTGTDTGQVPAVSAEDKAEAERKRRVAEHEAYKVRADHARENLVMDKKLPGRTKFGGGMVEIQVGKDPDGKFMVRHSTLFSSTGHSSPLSGAYDTAEEAYEAGRAEVERDARTVLRNDSLSDADKKDAKKALTFIGADQEPDPKPSEDVPAAPTAAEVAAAAAQADPEPTEGQKEAGNYQKGHITWNGLDITIENAKGSTRSGTSPTGKQWSVKMPAHYGYIKRTEGADGDHVDVYIGDNPDSDVVVVIDQIDPATGAFDEHKVMLGFTNRKTALDFYVQGFSDGKGADRLGGHKILTVEQFKNYLKNNNWKLPFSLRGKHSDEPQLFHAGFADRFEGKPRAVPSYVKLNPRQAGYQAYLRGWDSANDEKMAPKMKASAAPVPPRRKFGDPDYTLADAEADLMDAREAYAAEGMIKNARTGDRMRQMEDLVKRMRAEAEATPASKRRLTGPPEGSQEVESLDGYAIGDVVEVPGRTIGTSRITALWTMQSPVGLGLMKKAEVEEISTGKLLDVLLFQIEKAKEAATPAREAIRDGDKVMVRFEAPDREELMTVSGNVFPTMERGPSVLVSDGVSGSVIVPVTRVRRATEVEAAAPEVSVTQEPDTPPEPAESPELAPIDTSNMTEDELFDLAMQQTAAAPEPAPEPAPAGDAETAWDSADDPQRERFLVRGGMSEDAARRYVGRDWADLTKTAQKAVEAALSGAQVGPKAPRAPRAPSASRPPRTAAQSAASAVKNIAGGTGDALDGLMQFFGGKNTLNSGPSFSKESYAAAKPLFVAAVRQFGEAGQDILETVKNIINALRGRGMDDAALQSMRPFVNEFTREVRAGFDPFADQAGESPDSQNSPKDDTTDQPGPEDDDDRPQIRDDGEGPLEEVDPDALQQPGEGGNAGGSDAGGGTAGGDPDRKPDGGRGKRGGSRGGGSSRGGSVRAGKRRGRVENQPPAAEPPDPADPESDVTKAAKVAIPAINYTITEDLRLGIGTEGQKFADNIAAITTLKQIEAENRRATPAEQAILARYVGWGGLANAFRKAGAKEGEGVAKGWEKRVAEVEALLDPAELKAARNSTKAAHYTSEVIVRGMWRAAERLGFTGGAVLEPSVGVGNFLGLMPQGLRGTSKVLAVEYDSLTARIAKQLYPASSVMHSGFEKVPLPSGSFALAIGNPPFGRDQLRFPYRNEVNGRTIHNQFFLASLDAVAPDGLMAMVVSHHLMDAQDSASRVDLAAMGDLVAGIRLPSNAFMENARTEVVTDILIFRKHSAEDQAIAPAAVALLRRSFIGPVDNNDVATVMQKMNIPEAAKQRLVGVFRSLQRWVPSSRVENFAGSGATISVNPYFLSRGNANVIGTMDASGTMNGPDPQLNVVLENPAEIGERLAAMIEAIPEAPRRDIIAERTSAAFERMAEAMRLSVEKAEPGRIRIDTDGSLKMVVDADTDGASKTFLVEMDLTPDTPFHGDYTFNATTEKWTSVEDVMGDDGKVLKVRKADGTLSTRNQKTVRVFDDLKAIPENRRWGEKRIEKLRDIIKIKNLMKRQLVLETQDGLDSQIEANREKLNAAYDAYVAKHGVLHSKEAIAIANVMPDGALALAAERMDNGKAVKAAIMSERVARPPEAIETAETPTDAVAVSLSERGVIDLERIASLLKTDEAGAIAAISEGENPLAFYDPELERWEAADMYLQGLVARKLKAATAAGLDANVAALEKAMPPRVESVNITPTLGSNWIPGRVYASFLSHLGYASPTVSYSEKTNTFSVAGEGEASPAWRSSDRAMAPLDIVDKMLNSMPIKVTRTDRDGNTYVDQEATAESQIKATEISAEFQDWVFQDEGRRQELTTIFNEKFNGRVIRQRNGSHLRLPGKSPAITLRTHQLNAIWRGITDSRVLYDHAVGAGKTFVGIARIMERRRMGLSRKALVVVPNHIIGQWEKDAKKLYPGANILAAEPSDFKGPERRRLFARIAAGDYDMVIIGHSSFGFIDIDPSTEQRFIETELAEALEALKEAEADAPPGRFKSLGVKQAEQLVTKLQTRLDKIREGGRDRLLTFEEMGIDDLTVDESHEFKNLSYTSRLTGVAGMGNKIGSKKAVDLHLKVRSLSERPGTSVAFLTGTPVSNSVAELYLVLRNLAFQELKDLGLENFDAWRSLFVSATTAFEPTESGGLKEVARLGREWTNMRALMDLYYSVTDAVSLDDVKRVFAEENPGQKFPVPPVKSQKGEKPKDREMVAVQPTDAQRRILRQIVEGFDSLPDIENPNERNIERLRLMDQARKVSLDARALYPRMNVEPGTGKIGATVENIERLYRKHDADKGAQVVFLDRSVPKAKGDEEYVAKYDAVMARMRKAQDDGDDKAASEAQEELDKFDVPDVEARRVAIMGGWNAYDEIKRQLVAKGIPADEIAFIQSAKNDAEKQEIFRKVRSGEIRVIIGSTPRMGAGTNVQDRLVALHHVDVTWKPSDIEQREGRIIRQGNVLLEKYGHDGFEVEVLAYATEMTIDAKMWALNSDKLKAINGLRKYDGAFGMEIEDEESASMAEMAALATGNPLMIERVTLQSDVNKLDIARRSFNNRMNGFRADAANMEKTINSAPDRLERIGQYRDIVRARRAEVQERSAARSANVNGTDYQDEKAAWQAALDAIAEQRKDNENARFKVVVDGTTLTVQEDIRKALDAKFGDPGFEAEIDGTTYILALRAGEALARKMNSMFKARADDGQTVLVDGVTVNGLPLEIDVSLDTYSRRQTAAANFGLIHRGSAMFEAYAAPASGEQTFTAMMIANRLWDLANRSTVESLDRREAGIKDSVERAEQELPGIKAELAKTWPRAEEHEQKKARLLEVVGLLDGATDIDRLGPAEEGDGDLSEFEQRMPSGWEVEADPPITDEAIAKITSDLNAELARSGLAGKASVRVVKGLVNSAGIEVQGLALGSRIGVNPNAAFGALDVMRHEIVHVLRNAALWGGDYGLFTAEEWRGLVREARRDKATSDRIDALYKDRSEAVRTEEKVAELYREWAAKRDQTGPVAGTLRKIMGFLEAVANALRGRGFQSAARTMEKIARGEVGGRGPDTPNNPRDSKGRYVGRAAEQMEARMPSVPYATSEAEMEAKERGVVGRLLTDAMGGWSNRYNLLSMVPGRALWQELGKNLPGAARYLRLKEQMDALRSKWHGKTDEVAQDWVKIMAKDRKSNDAMMGLMHDATRAGVDPSEPFKSPQRRPGVTLQEHADQVRELKAQYDDLRPRFNALPAEFQTMFRRVRDTYDDMATAFERAILDNVKKAMDIGLKRAQHAYDAAIQKIADDGLTGQAKADAEADAAGKLAAAKRRHGWGQNARLSSLRAKFESNRLDGPYFPLQRFGNYFVTVRDKGGKVVSFSKFESEKTQQAFAAEMEKQGLAVESGVMEDNTGLREQVDPGFVADIEKILGDEVGDPAIMDMVWQRWLETLPDFSVRKSRIHRKGTPGFSGDAFRAFGRQVFHGGHQLARLTYGQDMQLALEDARREAAATRDPNRAGMIVNEMERRHQFVMNPTGGALAQGITSAAFVYYLGATPAAAVVNLTQTTVVGIPMLSAAFEKTTIARAGWHLQRAMGDFTRGRGKAERSARLTADERAAMKDAYDSGLIEATQSHDLAGVAESGVEYSSWRTRVMSKIAWMFHQAERTNREVTYLAAYRLARENGFAHEGATTKARDLTWKTHFDYQNTSRPRVMQNDFAKVVLVFRNFQIQMLWRLFRDLHQWTNGKTKAEQREARGQLVGITAMMMLHAGIRGTWGYALIMTMLGLFGGGADEVEDELTEAMVNTFGPGAAGLLLNGVPGHLTGLDLTNRIGMPELWFRAPDRQLEGKDAYTYWLEQVIGAAPGIVARQFMGLDIAMEGDLWRGVETAAPKFIRDLMKGWRFGSEGVTTMDGEPLVENVPPGMAFMQAMGFTPAVVSERFDQNRKLKNRDMAISRDRTALLREATDAIRAGEKIDPDTLLAIGEFNAENPDSIITGDSILRSLRSRLAMSERFEDGVALTPGRNARLREEAAPTIYQ